MNLKFIVLPISIVGLFVATVLAGLAIRHQDIAPPRELVARLATAARQVWAAPCDEPIAVINGSIEANSVLAGPRIEGFVASVQLATRPGQSVHTFCNQLPDTSAVAYVTALYDLLVTHWRYRSDPVVTTVYRRLPVEVLRRAEVMLTPDSSQYLTGDCDDVAMVLMTCLSVRQIDSRLVLIAEQRDARENGHAFIEVLVAAPHQRATADRIATQMARHWQCGDVGIHGDDIGWWLALDGVPPRPPSGERLYLIYPDGEYQRVE